MSLKRTAPVAANPLLKVIMGLIFIVFSVTTAADSLNALVKVCSACHGAEGFSSDASIPNLAGQKQAYMEAEIQFMRDGARKNPMMEAVVKDLTDQQIKTLASYYSNKPATATASEELNKLGQNVRALCVSCHGGKGITVNDQWPNLAGQQAVYLEKQLLAFRDDSRNGFLMQVIAKELTIDQIKAVAEYYSQQPGR